MCQTLLNTENPDLKIQSRPLQSSQPGAADADGKHQSAVCVGAGQPGVGVLL